MAHYAKLGINSKVISTVVVDNNNCMDADGNENEEVGRQFLENLTGWPLWKKYSYNTIQGKYYDLVDNVHTLSDNQSKAFRKNAACIGMTYDEDRDAFLGIKPYDSWVLDETTCMYKEPIPKPTTTTYTHNTQTYYWIFTWSEVKGTFIGYKPETGETDFSWTWNKDTLIWEEDN